ncbi:protein of unknown function (DUF4263) [Micromonospora viridifaciens]|uniref:Shedu protein SduA C-terminal domain-containing protein n=1 Tax=Micromonospora viridifaciens TaxID=1881 RepID=A0A1C4YE21_MICVI|nr:protein of unknown function (DUF4263) [Micromonospora viridifaciens]
MQEFVAHIDAGRVDPEIVHRVVTAICASPHLAEALARMDDAGLLATLIERNRQRVGLDEWRKVVEDPTSREPDIQRVLNKQWWIFGGRYIKPAIRRQFVVGEQLDMALVRADGALHVVEIKQANIPKLIVPHRTHYRVGDEIHEAVSQAMNYLRSLDEERDTILSKFHVDSRRAFATVVIGHPRFVSGDIAPEVVADTIRTYNSHLSRIEVVTYADLIDGAERAFALSNEGEAESDVEDCITVSDASDVEEEDWDWPPPF